MPTGGKLEFRTVSIHAPREGCDTDYHMSVDQRVKFQFTHPGRGATFLMEDIKQGKEFQFTHPGRGATVYSGADGREMRVSIHAPREGCDPRPSSCPCRRRSFNSRTPGGVRRRTQNIRYFPMQFQFTHPGMGATMLLISIPSEFARFNSRTPGGVRRGGGARGSWKT